MKVKKATLLERNDEYVFVVARKLHKGDSILVSETGQRLKPKGSDWGFLSVHSSVSEADRTLEAHLEIARKHKEKETYGILSFIPKDAILLKSERA